MEGHMPVVSMIAAIGRRREIGNNNALLWHIPDDLKRFRSLTRGHPVIMGRKTFDSIAFMRGGGLPDRPNIVVTRDVAWHFKDVVTVNSIGRGIEVALAMNQDEIFVIGGAEIYAQTLPQADRLYLTLIDDEREADSFFPAYESEFTEKTLDEAHEWNGLKYRWVNLERKAQS